MNLFDFFNFFSPAHNEIAKNGADKVLSSEEENSSVHRAYVNFLTSRKSALDVPLYAISSGRSMVEMLGVLAIIGVLSVGAMAGYAKAMFKYKLNKQTEQINQVMMALIEHKSLFAAAKNNESLTSLFIKLNTIPPEMIQNNQIYDVFDCFVDIKRDSRDEVNNMYYSVSLTNFTDENHDICRNILESFKGYAAELVAIGVNSNTAEDINQQEWYYGAQAGVDTAKTISTLNLEKMQSICQKCDNNACSVIAAFPTS